MLSDHALLAILTGLNGLQLVVLAWSLWHHRTPHFLAPTHGPHGPVG